MRPVLVNRDTKKIALKIIEALEGQSVTIGGPNRAGKTSAIRGLVAALGGKELLPEDPVRHGAEAGRVVVELPEFVVRLDVEPDRSTRLRVETLDGARFTSPQTQRTHQPTRFGRFN